MSNNNNFHLHFMCNNQSYDLDFMLDEASSNKSVLIDGKSYELRGDMSKIMWLKEKFPEFNEPGFKIDQLQHRLKVIGATEIMMTLKVDSIAAPIFLKPDSEGKWILEQKASIPGKRQAVAHKYWEKNVKRFSKIAKTMKHIERLQVQQRSAPRGKTGRLKRRSLSTQIDIHKKRLYELQQPDRMFLQFLKNCSDTPSLIENGYLTAINEQNREEFEKLFLNLTAEQLLSIDGGEKLHAIPKTHLSEKPVVISKSDLKNLQEYMRDTQFSGVVTLSDKNATYTLSTANIQDPQVPFAIHSVGKVFTGVLTLRMIEEQIVPKAALEAPIQLAPDVVEKLSPKVQEQLKHATLRDVMLHLGRLGDYLGNYQDAIERSLKENKLPPIVEAPQDFLQFADRDLVTPNESGYSYSNLGILLVGLSLEHLYNSQTEEKKTYDELLQQYVLEPSGVQTYEKHKPDKARVNPQDKVSPHITGGPAGGAWSTVGDLALFGQWLGDKYNDSNSDFRSLVEEFGGEFFANNEFSHGGSIESASAHLSHRLGNGVTITIVCDKEGLGLASDLAQTIQENLLQETSLERLSR